MVVKVEISADVYLVCLLQALSTEKEEVMGLLIGELMEEDVACVCALFMMRRSDKQADRVEISPEQLTAATIEADRLATELQRPVRVMGWFHSHPHITVWPSHVDVCTQANYQLMDPHFIGLIVSCFNQEGKHVSCGTLGSVLKVIARKQKIQITCFQSFQAQNGSGFERAEVPFVITPTLHGHLSSPCLSALLQLPNILLEEEEEAFQSIMKKCSDSVLSQIENTAIYTQSVCHILEVICGPVADLLKEQIRRNKAKKERLLKEKQQLQEELGDLAGVEV